MYVLHRCSSSTSESDPTR